MYIGEGGVEAQPGPFSMKSIPVGCFRNKQTKNFRFEPKQTETKFVLVDFLFVSQNKKNFVSVRFGIFYPFRNNRNK
jgi:hypothetical protein